jgi:steroid 5-alpha reductase family enzyme
MDPAMIDLSAWFLALGAVAAAAFATWIVSVFRRDVSIVDSLWSVLFLLVVLVYVGTSEQVGPRAWLATGMVALWALRLSIYITVRNHGEPEDRRYRAIRRNNQPHFWLKSLFMVFLLQGFLAWVIVLPALAAVSGQASPGPLDWIGVVLWAAGFLFESAGDWQLARFRRGEGSGDAVLDTGLWRYTRHPNYFGEALLWWGIYLLAVGAGAWWTVFAPLLMTYLLLRVSGVALLEKDISDRRPAYRKYVERTSAFVPWPPRT